MRTLVLFAAAAALVTLCGCQRKEAAAVGAPVGPGGRGRFVAVGIYMPGQMWTQVAPPASASGDPLRSEPAAATLEDDEQVIVVLDSTTGEVRQCGNLSGRCLAMNPWSTPVGGAPGAPASLLKHARVLAAERDAAQREAEAHPERHD